MSMKPIETEYAGHRFRSRLEARWAIALDHMGVKWEYEAQGYTLSDGSQYLPDFYLPELRRFLEVKPGDMPPCTKVYLAGSMGSDWRSQFIPYCGNTNPQLKGDHGAALEESGRFVVTESLKGINKCDVLFALLDRPEMYGTIAEIGYAAAKGKKVIVAMIDDAMPAVADDEEPSKMLGHNAFDLSMHGADTWLESKLAFGEWWFACEMAGTVWKIASINEAVAKFYNQFAPPDFPEGAKALQLSIDSGMEVVTVYNIPFEDVSLTAYENGRKRWCSSWMLGVWPNVYLDACKIAKAARFEFGQTPKRPPNAR